MLRNNKEMEIKTMPCFSLLIRLRNRFLFLVRPQIIQIFKNSCFHQSYMLWAIESMNENSFCVKTLETLDEPK